MIRLVCFCLFVGLTASQKAIHFTSCGGDVKEVRVTPCVDEPCYFKRGSTVVIEADFIANSGSANPQISVKAKFGPMEIGLPGLKSDACYDYNLSCPLRKGQTYTFKHSLNILPIYPKLNTTAIYKLRGGEEGILFCFEAPVKITSED